MLNISKQQALQRWEVLPDSLREALFSEYNADTLWKICEAQHLPEDKISKVAILLGDVIFGFVHLDDLAKDIALETGINQQIADSIVQEIDRKILPPIKSDIEKNYKPAMSEPLPARRPEMPIAPKISKEPVSPLDIIKEAPSIQKPPIETPSPKPSIPSVSPASPSMAVASEEGPLIIHKETEFKPLSKNGKSLGGLFNFLNKGQKEKKKTISPIKAKVEIGPETFEAPTEASGGKKESGKAATSTPKIRVVHYADFHTPLSSPFTGKKQSKTQQVPPVQKPFVPSVPQPTSQPIPQSSLRDLSKPIPPPTSSIPPTPTTPPAPKKTEEKKNDNLEGNIIDLRSFK